MKRRKIPSSFFAPKKQKSSVPRAYPQHPSSRNQSRSRFQTCPLCEKSLPTHSIEAHAANCNGNEYKSTSKCENGTNLGSDGIHARNFAAAKTTNVGTTDKCSKDAHIEWRNIMKCDAVDKNHSNSKSIGDSNIMCNIHDLPGLYLFEEFISKEEEQEIIHHLDGTKYRANECGHENQMRQQSNDNDHDDDGDYYLPWKPSRFNGKHLGKRWGVHCSLKDRKVYPVDNPLPACIQAIMDRIETGPETKTNNVHSQIRRIMKGCKLNEANAIDYRRAKGDFLKNHVDDRQLSKEPIANLSLAGDCYMTFRRESGRKFPSTADETKVVLKRRTLQILTGSARYNYSHGIGNEDLLTDRRISITMRESPLSK